jgi:hypothetical protein
MSELAQKTTTCGLVEIVRSWVEGGPGMSAFSTGCVHASTASASEGDGLIVCLGIGSRYAQFLDGFLGRGFRAHGFLSHLLF